ncbi:hypothetical protein RB653_006266 [Dictyostelium firmibasis]|uniref:Uncharacterized protein n=1 Tax=Dictyostelium firmibasis TaxID=79012 RepID=A0AAN7UAZ5_9MYCE
MILQRQKQYSPKLDDLPKEILIIIFIHSFDLLKKDKCRNLNSKIFQHVFISKVIANALLNSTEFWTKLISSYIFKDILSFTSNKLDRNVYNLVYYCASQYKIRDYFNRNIKGQRLKTKIQSSKYMSSKTAVCSIPFESSFIVGGLGTNKYPFLRAFNYKGEEQINYLQMNRVEEYRNKPIESITCRNKVLGFSVLGSDIISICKTNDLNEDKCGYLQYETIRTESTAFRNRVKLSPSDENKLVVGGSDGSVNIHDLNQLLSNDGNDNGRYCGDNEHMNVISEWGYMNGKLPIWDSCFSNNGKCLFVVGESILNCESYYKNTGFVRYWDTREEPQKMVWQLKEGVEVGGIAQSHDSNRIAYVLRGGLVRVFDLRSPKNPLALFMPESALNYNYNMKSPFNRDTVAWLPGGCDNLVSSYYNEINVWSMNETEDSFPIMLDKIRPENHHNQLDITDDGLLLCSYDTIYSLNDISDKSIIDYLNNEKELEQKEQKEINQPF